MKLVCKALILPLLAVTVASAVACSSNTGTGTSPPEAGERRGEVGVNLTLAGGSTLTSLNFSLTNGVTADAVTGPVPLPTGPANAPVVVPTFEIVPVIAASGYSISMNGTSSDGNVVCSGAAGPFNVTAGNETVVNVLVTCVSTLTSGSVEVTATVQSCPTVNTLTAINATANTTAPGNTSTIFAAAVGPNQATVTYAFSLTAGTGSLSSQATVTGATATSILFTCPPFAEVDTIQLVTADQPGPTTCPASLSTASVKVSCGSCVNVGSGVEATPNNATGTCPAGQANTLADSVGNFCCAQMACYNGATQVGTGTVATPDTAAGTCPTGQSNSLTDTKGNFCCALPFCSGAPFGVACDAGLVCNGGVGCVTPSFAVARVLEFDAGGDADPSSAVVIEQHLLDGSVTGTPVALPTAASGSVQPFTVGGTAVSEGDLNTSTNGLYLTMAGYQAAPGVVSIDTSTTVPREVARVDANNNVVTTLLPGAFMGGDPSSAVTVDGSEYWVSGTGATATGSGGIWYLPTDLEIVQFETTALAANARLLRIGGGQLYGDSAQDPPYLFTVGNGLPTMASTLTTLPGAPGPGSTTPSPYSFVLFDLDPTIPGVDTLYAADDRPATGGGLEKWMLSSGGTWSVTWTVQMSGTGIRGLAGYVTGTAVTLMASSANTLGKQDALALVLDTAGSTSAPTASQVTVLVTSGLGSTFRGVAIPPHL